MIQMLPTTLPQSVRFIIVIPFLIIFLSACGGGNLDDITEKERELDNLGNYSGEVAIDIVSEPYIQYNANDGSTDIALQFIPRTKNGLPLTPEQIDVELKIDGKPINVEDKLSSSSTALTYNVHYILVLDTSYSMLENKSFAPMLSAAQSSVQKGVDIWKNRSGSFTFQTTWFNSFLYSSENTNNWTWTPTDISSIPEPVVGARTKLYAGINYSLDKLIEKQAAKNENDEKFQNIMLIFSDGIDNYSHFANQNSLELNPEDSFTTSTGAPYIKQGSDAVNLDSVLEKIGNVTDLTVHVIGLGKDNDLDVASLTKVANTGNGQYFSNPQTDEVLNLFNRVTSEFTTLQSRGINSTLDVGEYNFSMHIKSKSGKVVTKYGFNFKAGDASAAIIPDVEE